jgi:hypothetical protein
MLKIQNFKKDDIVSVKLMNGEEVIVKLGEVTDTTYEFIKPLVLSIGHQGAALTSYMITAKAEKLKFVIDKDKIIAMAEVQEEISTEYTKATTGLVTASAGKIIQ